LLQVGEQLLILGLTNRYNMIQYKYPNTLNLFSKKEKGV